MQDKRRLTLWEKLDRAGLVEGERAVPKVESPWYVKLLLSISGWFGAVFLLFFMGGILNLIFVGGIEEHPTALAIVGSGLIFFAYQMFQEKQEDFLEHFILVLSMTGQAMVIASLFLIFDERAYASIFLFVALFQAFLMWVVPNYLHRMISAFFMALGLSYFFYELGEPFVPSMILTFVMAYLWINEFRWVEHKRVEAIAYGITAGLLWLNYSFLFTPHYFYELFDLYEKPLFYGGVVEFGRVATLAYLLWKILKESKREGDKKLLMLLGGTLFLLSFIAMKIGALLLGILLIVIGFAHAHHLLTGLGIFSSLVFLSNYYYYTGETLMEKAGLLALMGVGLLLSRLVMKRVLEKEASDV